MKKIVTICCLILNIQCLFGQNYNIGFGVKDNISTTSVNINTSEETPSITLQQININNFCPDTELEIPFTTSGKFEANNTFTLYFVYEDGTVFSPISTTTKSPFKLKLPYANPVVILVSNPSIRSNTMKIPYKSNTSTPYVSYETLSGCTKINLKVDTTYSWNKYDSYQWKLDGIPIKGANSFQLSAIKSGNYDVEVSKNGCTLNSFNNNRGLDVTLGKIPQPSIYPYNTVYICQGLTDTLRFDSYNLNRNLSYQWNLNGVPIENANKANQSVNKSGSYSLTIKEESCEATSNPIYVSVGDVIKGDIDGYSTMNGVYYSSDNNQIKICKGSTFTLYIHSSDSLAIDRGITKIQWQKDGVDIIEATNKRFTGLESGNYRARFLQGNCVYYSKIIKVSFTEKLKYKIDSYYGYRTKSTIIACGKDSLDVKLYSPGITTWYRDGKIVEKTLSYSSFVVKSGKYWAIQTYSETCNAYSDTLEVKFSDVNTEFNYDNKNVSSCLDTIRLYSDYYNSDKFRWKFNGNYLPKDTTNSLKVYQSGTYQWEAYTKTCQFVSSPFTVTFGKLDETLESPYRTVPCYGEIFFLHPQVKSYTYYYDSKDTTPIAPLTFQWQKDGVDFSKEEYLENVPKGTYSVTIKQKNCTVTTNPITIDYIKIPREISPKDSTFICPNGGFMELASAANSSYNFTWIKDKKVIPNQIKASIKANETGIYQAQIESGECATMTYPVKVFQKLTLPTANISGSKEINAGDSTRIKIDLTSSAPWTIKLTNSQTFTAEKTPFEFNVKPTQTTVYELASVKNGCGDGTVNGKAEVKIVILGTEEIEGAKINLFPVPTQSTCQLTVEMALPEKLDWQLFNSDGKLLSKAEKTKIVPFFSQSIDLESLPSGIYLLKIIIGNKIATRKIIKQN